MTPPPVIYVPLITDDQVKELATLNKNATVSTSMGSQIRVCQETRLKPFLGDDFYAELMSQASTSTLTADNLTLLSGYIRPYLANWLLYDNLPHIWAQTREQGVVNMRGDYADNVGQDQMILVREQYEQAAKAYEQQMKKFLCKYSSVYPLYCTGEQQYKATPGFFVV